MEVMTNTASEEHLKFTAGVTINENPAESQGPLISSLTKQEQYHHYGHTTTLVEQRTNLFHGKISEPSET
jgi:hypothetical protein